MISSEQHIDPYHQSVHTVTGGVTRNGSMIRIGLSSGGGGSDYWMSEQEALSLAHDLIKACTLSEEEWQKVYGLKAESTEPKAYSTLTGSHTAQNFTYKQNFVPGKILFPSSSY